MIRLFLRANQVNQEKGCWKMHDPTRGLTWRRRLATSLGSTPQVRASETRDPSGPRVGPSIRSDAKRPRRRCSTTDASVFSCAPPTMRRVMTWATRGRPRECSPQSARSCARWRISGRLSQRRSCCVPFGEPVSADARHSWCSLCCHACCGLSATTCKVAISGSQRFVIGIFTLTTQPQCWLVLRVLALTTCGPD